MLSVFYMLVLVRSYAVDLLMRVLVRSHAVGLLNGCAGESLYCWSTHACAGEELCIWSHCAFRWGGAMRQMQRRLCCGPELQLPSKFTKWCLLSVVGLLGSAGAGPLPICAGVREGQPRSQRRLVGRGTPPRRSHACGNGRTDASEHAWRKVWVPPVGTRGALVRGMATASL